MMRTDEIDDVDWDDRQAEFRRAANDASLPKTLREALHAFLRHQEDFNDWVCNADHGGNGHGWKSEAHLNEDLGPAETLETAACLALHGFRAGTCTESAVADALSKARAYYVRRLALGTTLTLPRTRARTL